MDRVRVRVIFPKTHVAVAAADARRRVRRAAGRGVRLVPASPKLDGTDRLRLGRECGDDEYFGVQRKGGSVFIIIIFRVSVLYKSPGCDRNVLWSEYSYALEIKSNGWPKWGIKNLVNKGCFTREANPP
jgi:hypothetical protein